MKLVSKYFNCECNSPEHTLRFSHFEPPEDDYPQLFVEVHLRRFKWHKRLWNAIKYVLGYQSCYGAFDEHLMDRNKAIELKDELEKFIWRTQPKKDAG